MTGISDDELLRLRAEGRSYQAIAALAGASRGWVRYRVRRLQRRKRTAQTKAEVEVETWVKPATGLEADPATPIRAYMPLMSVRAWNALALRFGDREPTVGDVRELGTRLLRIPTFGSASYREVCGLFGMPSSGK
jgi:DNA-binding Lrp family transcriptional regulator